MTLSTPVQHMANTLDLVQKAMEPKGDWHEWHDNRALTARWMADNGYSARDLAYFVEKPWKYGAEYLRAKAEFDDPTQEG